MKKKKVLKIMLIVVLILAIALGAGYMYLYNNGMSGKMLEVDPPVEGQIKVACVGDSITYGHGIKDWEHNNYPVVLQSLLGEDYHVRNFGVSGRAVQDDSDQPYTALEFYNQSLEYDADIVVFMMGSNDTKPENWKGADAYREDLCAILDSYGDAQIILCTPACCFFTEKHTGPTTSHDLQPAVAEEMAQIVREVAEERGYVLVDIYALTQQNPQWFAADGVHPNNEGAAAIADAVCEAISNLNAE